jgi:hypothetical protein
MWPGIFLVVAGCLPLSACAGGPDLDRLAADTTITTGSIAGVQAPALSDELDADRLAMRNSVSAADLTRMETAGIPWANPATGSRGTITAITEYKEQGLLCRGFASTRESYDGVTLYRGKICLGPAGRWAMLDFGAAGGEPKTGISS